MGKPALGVLCCVLLLSTPFTAVAVATGATATESGDHPIAIEFEQVRSDGGDVFVSGTVVTTDGTPRFLLSAPFWEDIVSTDGFEPTSSDSVWRWDGRTRNPTFEVRLSAEHSSETWAVFRQPEVSLHRNAGSLDDAFEPERRLDTAERYSGDVQRFGTVVVHGDYDVTSERIDGETVHVVEMGDAEPESNASRAFSVLRVAKRNLDVGGAANETAIVVVPASAWFRRSVGGYVPDGRTAYINARSFTPETLVHEYVHTRQDFRTEADVEWFFESAAAYYGGLVASYAGSPMEHRTYGGYLRSETTLPNRPLTKGGADCYEGKPDAPCYQQDISTGAHHLAALDYEIRVRTNGRHSLEDVFARLNAYDGRTVDYETFRAMVVDVAGEEIAAWLDRYVDGGAFPTAPKDVTKLPPDSWDRSKERLSLCNLEGDPIPVSMAENRTISLTHDRPVAFRYVGYRTVVPESNVSVDRVKGRLVNGQCAPPSDELYSRTYVFRTSGEFNVSLVDMSGEAESVTLSFERVDPEPTATEGAAVTEPSRTVYRSVPGAGKLALGAVVVAVAALLLVPMRRMGSGP